MMNGYFRSLFDFLLHIDIHLAVFAASYGMLIYCILFLIVFCETGLVVTPFLPGDSLLFTAGSLATQYDATLNPWLLFFVLTLASSLGNFINYLLGRAIGPRVFSYSSKWFLKQSYLEQARLFYEKHGGKTIIFARFMPILRTFAPFVAGIGTMEYGRFLFYNLTSAILWVGSLLGLGYFFGSLPLIKNNFTWVIYGIIAISFLPMVISFFCHRWKKNHPQISAT